MNRFRQVIVRPSIPSRTQTTIRLLAMLLVALLAACGGNEAASIPDDIWFRDQFVPGESGDWLLEGDDLGRTAVIDQKLVIAINQPNTMQYAALSEPVFTNYSVEVDAQQTAGNPIATQV